MDRGIIGMPFEMAMSSELSRRQFYERAQAILAERDQLRAEAEALRKDAERYRWIDHQDGSWAVIGEAYGLPSEHDGAENLRSAIDAAMAAKEGV